MPKTSSQATSRTQVAAAKKAIKSGEFLQAKELLDAAINRMSNATDQLKARYIRATAMFGLGDYAESELDLEFCLNHLLNNPPEKTDLVVDCLFLWFWATQRQNYNPKNQQDFLNLALSRLV